MKSPRMFPLNANVCRPGSTYKNIDTMKVLVLLLAILMASTGFAGLDELPDSFGIYFDADGNTNTTTPMTTSTKTMYIILKNLTAPVGQFYVAYRIVPHQDMALTIAQDLVRVSDVIAGGSHVSMTDYTDPVIAEYTIGYVEPRPAAPMLLLVTRQLRYYGEEDLGMDFYLSGTSWMGGLNGLPGIVDEHGARSGNISSGSLDIPVASTAQARISHGISGNLVIDTVTAVDDDESVLPKATTIGAIYPNPFNPRTVIAFDLAEAGPIELAIYDVSGRMVRVMESCSRSAGRYQAVWDGQDGAGHGVPSGLYFCRLSTLQESQTRKLTLAR